ncbi:MAG: glycosyltransferase family 2 protein [Bacilli bacterium]
MLLEILFIIFGLLTLYCLLLELYSVFLSIFGYKKIVKDYPSLDPESRFLILVAAHNEEEVIGSTIENLNRIDYPKELYDIYVVNDNSIDRTAEICDELSMMHIDTCEKKFSKEGVGKSAGLQYALRDLGFDRLKEKYDMLLILDADNHVDPNILSEINSQYIYENKPTAIQVYLDSKNAHSMIAIGYATAYNITNRFFQYSKKRLGLNNAIGGTGFAVRMDWLLKTGGFCYKSLVEDLEMSIEIFKDGGEVVWNHHTRIYDEKPDTLGISVRQRTRWCQGHWFVAFNNGLSLLKGFFKSKFDWRYMDQFLYLFNMGRALSITILLAAAMLSISTFILHQNGMGISIWVETAMNFIIPSTYLRLLLALYSYVWLPIYANKIDGTHKVSPIKNIASVFYVGVTYIYTQILGLFKWRQQGVWVKTPHKHASKQ